MGSLTKVGTETYEQHLNSQLAPLKNEDGADAIKVAPAVKAALAAKTALENLSCESKSWEAPFDHEKMVDNLFGLSDAWGKALKLLENVRDSIHRLGLQVKEGVQTKKKKVARTKSQDCRFRLQEVHWHQ